MQIGLYMQACFMLVVARAGLLEDTDYLFLPKNRKMWATYM